MDTSESQLAYALDPTPGAPLGSGIAWQKLNFVSHDINPSAESTRSKVLRPDASTQDARRTSFSIGGTLAMELARDPELEALMAIALRGTWVSNVLKAGVAKSLVAFEDKLTTDAGAAAYTRHRGCGLGGFALEVSQDGLADIRFPIMGWDTETAAAITTTATYVNAGTAPVAAGVDFTGLTLSGLTNQLDLESISIDMTNNMRTDRKLGSQKPRGTAWGQREVNIEMTAWWEDNEAYEKFKADGVTAASFGFTPPGGTAGFDFAFDRCRFSSFGRPIPGQNQTIQATLGLIATYDSTNGTDFRITRRV